MAFDKFVIVINSSNYYQRTTNVNNQTYLFNNTNIPAGNYKCRWSIKTGIETTAAFNVYPTIYLETQNSQQAFSANSTGGNVVSYCLGPARQFINTANSTSYYYSNATDNVNFYWNYRPGYELRVILRSAVSQTILHGGSSDYILMIEMEKVG
jgi:hypothetical protein